MLHPATLMLFLLFSSLVVHGDAKAINLTVDDQFVSNSADQPSIQYDGDWKKDGFRILHWDPSSSKLARQFATSMNGTWTTSTFSSAQSSYSVAQFNFTGTAVFVQCILAHATRDRIPGNSQILFTIDGVNTIFTQDALAQDVATVTTVFSKTDLSFEAHTLNIQNGFPGGAHSEGMILLDSITYTIDEPPAAPNLSEPTLPAASHSSLIASTVNHISITDSTTGTRASMTSLVPVPSASGPLRSQHSVSKGGNTVVIVVSILVAAIAQEAAVLNPFISSLDPPYASTERPIQRPSTPPGIMDHNDESAPVIG
ncbi:hypothetical protein ONZ45_g2806 [Pleurotus djamor]|nr:hypothetical protein ONZ45_g2806 [Pleurotus djamor]